MAEAVPPAASAPVDTQIAAVPSAPSTAAVPQAVSTTPLVSPPEIPGLRVFEALFGGLRPSPSEDAPTALVSPRAGSAGLAGSPGIVPMKRPLEGTAAATSDVAATGVPPRAMKRPRPIKYSAPDAAVQPTARSTRRAAALAAGPSQGESSVMFASPAKAAATSAGAVLNRDYCEACGGKGHFLCCDGCPRSFHFACLEPPLELDELPASTWYCKVCKLERADGGLSAFVSKPKSMFGDLIRKAETESPRVFRLPPGIQTHFKDVSIGNAGEYVDIRSKRKPGKTGFLEEREPFKTRDKNGKAVLCFKCRKAPSTPLKPVVSCDFCDTHWHIDCLDPPLLTMPPAGHRWMCPLHVEQSVRRPRVPKSQSTVTVSGPMVANAGEVDIVLRNREQSPEWEELTVNHIRYQVPEEVVILDFLGALRGEKPKPMIRPPAPRKPRIARIRGGPRIGPGGRPLPPRPVDASAESDGSSPLSSVESTPEPVAAPGQDGPLASTSTALDGPAELSMFDDAALRLASEQGPLPAGGRKSSPSTASNDDSGMDIDLPATSAPLSASLASLPAGRGGPRLSRGRGRGRGRARGRGITGDASSRNSSPRPPKVKAEDSSVEGAAPASKRGRGTARTRAAPIVRTHSTRGATAFPPPADPASHPAPPAPLAPSYDITTPGDASAGLGPPAPTSNGHWPPVQQPPASGNGQWGPLQQQAIGGSGSGSSSMASRPPSPSPLRVKLSARNKPSIGGSPMASPIPLPGGSGVNGSRSSAEGDGSMAMDTDESGGPPVGLGIAAEPASGVSNGASEVGRSAPAATQAAVLAPAASTSGPGPSAAAPRRSGYQPPPRMTLPAIPPRRTSSSTSSANSSGAGASKVKVPKDPLAAVPPELRSYFSALINGTVVPALPSPPAVRPSASASTTASGSAPARTRDPLAAVPAELRAYFQQLIDANNAHEAAKASGSGPSKPRTSAPASVSAPKRPAPPPSAPAPTPAPRSNAAAAAALLGLSGSPTSHAEAGPSVSAPAPTPPRRELVQSFVPRPQPQSSAPASPSVPAPVVAPPLPPSVPAPPAPVVKPKTPPPPVPAETSLPPKSALDMLADLAQTHQGVTKPSGS